MHEILSFVDTGLFWVFQTFTRLGAFMLWLSVCQVNTGTAELSNCHYCWLINLCDVEVHVGVRKYSLDNQESGWWKLIYDYLLQVFLITTFSVPRKIPYKQWLNFIHLTHMYNACKCYICSLKREAIACTSNAKKKNPVDGGLDNRS